jgi:RNA polymerase sigma-70 factor (ECF subfamily)
MAIERVPAPSDPIAVLIQAGEHREAITACIHHHGVSIGRLCMALLGDQAEAEETVQEALIAAHDSFANWREEGSPKAWVHGIARRMCNKRLAKRVCRERRMRLVHDVSRDAELPDDVIERRQRAETVRSALDELKPSDREALLLRFESGLSFREIADLAEVDEATARKRTSRALARFRLAHDQVSGGAR